MQQGDILVIAKSGEPVAILGPVHPATPKRARGVLKAQINLDPSFDEPLVRRV